MKLLFLLLFIPTIAFCNQKDSFKYHFKINAYPLPQQQYSGAFNLGFETRVKKVNVGVDWFAYNHSIIIPTKYRFDTLMHRTRKDSFISYSGLAFNFSKSINIKNTNNRFIVGMQAIVGSGRSYTSTKNETFDSVRQLDIYGNIHTIENEMKWQNDKNLKNGYYSYLSNDLIKGNTHLTLGLAIFCRLEFLVYKRFLFSPEFKLPIIYNSGQKYFNVDINPGLSFNLAYKLGKLKTKV